MEHGICFIAEFTSPWLNCAHSNRIPAEIWQFLILIFQDGGRRHLKFSKFQFFNDRNGQESRTASSRQISSKLFKRRLTYCYFQFFKMTAAVILDVKNFTFLTVGTVTTFEIHHRSKFRHNRLNRWRDMAIFDLIFLTVGRSRGSDCINMPNFVEITQTAADVWPFFNFSRWRPPPSWILEISNF